MAVDHIGDFRSNEIAQQRKKKKKNIPDDRFGIIFNSADRVRKAECSLLSDNGRIEDFSTSSNTGGEVEARRREALGEGEGTALGGKQREAHQHARTSLRRSLPHA